MKATREYCAKNGIVLDEELLINDLGVSAFNGNNHKSGGLGLFLNAVEEGKVPSGSMLIVESLDRISRQSVTKHLPLFLNLIEKGITILTLMDGKSYSKESLDKDPYGFIMAIATMGRAHEESATKSKRLSASWKAKRASSKILTSICPAWLRFDKQNGKFEIIQERADVVQRIFELAASGVGRHSIAKMLNAEGEAAWKNGRGWHESYIEKILSNRAVLGEFQPHRKVEGKRIPDGLARIDYFPQIIQIQQFQTAKLRRQQNRKFVGKTGKNATSNLFTGVAVCGHTGFPMVYVNKTKWRYLVSDHAKRGLGSKYKSWPYEDFENRFLVAVKGIDLVALKPDECSENQLLEEIDAKQKEIEDLRQRGQFLVGSLEQAMQKPELVVERIAELEARSKAEEKILADLRQRLNSLIKDDNGKNFLDTIEEFEKHRNDPLVRIRLKNEIREKIKQIRVFPAGAPFYETQYGRGNPIVIVEFHNSRQFIYGKYEDSKAKPETLREYSEQYEWEVEQWKEEAKAMSDFWAQVPPLKKMRKRKP